MIVYQIYTDASFDKESSLATCGFLIIENGKKEKHTVFTVAGIKTSTQAESFAIHLALNELIKIE